jgi:hypothetical protein
VRNIAAPLPPTVAPAAMHNLPFAVTRMIAARKRQAVVSRLSRQRLVTIVGPGGIGKTTVALAVAERVIAGYERGVWLVDLDRSATPPGAERGCDRARSGNAHRRSASRPWRCPQRQSDAAAARQLEHLIRRWPVWRRRFSAERGVSIATSREPLEWRVNEYRLTRSAARRRRPD